MALIHCAECNREISDRAVSCPGCGAPIAAQPSGPDSAEAVQTIQATGKSWKGQQLLAFLLIAIGVFVAVGWGAAGSGTGAAAGSIMFIVGFIWFIGARVGAWWHHG